MIRLAGAPPPPPHRLSRRPPRVQLVRGVCTTLFSRDGVNRLMNLQWMAGLTLSLLSLSVLAGTGQAATLNRGIGNDPDSLDPHKAIGTSASILIYDLFEGLVTVDAKGQIAPGAASEWKVDATQKVYTFTLRPNLKWSDGSALTAADFERRLLQTIEQRRQFGRDQFRPRRGRAQTPAVGLRRDAAKRGDVADIQNIFGHRTADPCRIEICPSGQHDLWPVQCLECLSKASGSEIVGHIVRARTMTQRPFESTR